MSDPKVAAAAETAAIPKAAPTPPSDSGPNPTDSQNVRKYDSEDIKTHGLDPAAAKKKSKTAPRHTTPLPVASSTPVNDLRRICDLLPIQPVRHAGSNFFIPCFGTMYSYLSVMIDKVCTLRPFGENGAVNDWIPQSAVIVYSVLAYVQLFRAAAFARSLTADQHAFVELFLSNFPLDTLVIPGPLVPFFRSLSVCSPGIGDFADVTPALPQLSFSEERVFNIDYCPIGSAVRFPDITLMVPHIPLMYEQFVHLIKYLTPAAGAAPRQYSTYQPLRKIFDLSAPAQGAPFRTEFMRLRRSVGFWDRPTGSNGLYARFASYIGAHHTSFPAPWAFDPTHAPTAAQPDATPPVAAVPANWSTFNSTTNWMMANENFNWFSILLRGMPNFTKYWKGNQSLLSISPLSSTAGLIQFQGVTIEAIPEASVFGRNDNLNSATHQMVYNSYATSSCPFLCNEDFQDAQIAQVNVECTTAATCGRRIGALDVTKFGPFWRITPDVVITGRGNLIPQLQSMIVTQSFFTE